MEVKEIGEAYIPRYQIIGKPRRHLQEISQSTKKFKDGKPRKSRIIGGYTRLAELQYVPLEESQASGFDTSGYPKITPDAITVVTDAAFEKNSLTNVRKRKTTIPYSPTVKASNRPSWESKLPPNATPYQRMKMKETAYRNELKRMFLRGEITFHQLALIIWGSGYSLTEPNFTEPEPSIRPFNSRKFYGSINRKELTNMRRQHRRRLALQRNIYHR